MTNETEAVRAVAWPEYLMVRDTGIYDDAGGLGQRIFTTAGAGYHKEKYVHASEIDRLTGEVSRLRDELRRIAELDPSEDSSEGFNEWGEAECFRIAQGHAKQALTQPEADHGY